MSSNAEVRARAKQELDRALQSKNVARRRLAQTLRQSYRKLRKYRSMRVVGVVVCRWTLCVIWFYRARLVASREQVRYLRWLKVQLDQGNIPPVRSYFRWEAISAFLAAADKSRPGMYVEPDKHFNDLATIVLELDPTQASKSLLF